MRRDGRSEGLRWLEQAEADRNGAQLLFDGGSYHLACFVGQQVAEKAVKAFIYAHGEEFVVGHSVEALCRWAGEFDEDFERKLSNFISILKRSKTKFENAYRNKSS